MTGSENSLRHLLDAAVGEPPRSVRFAEVRRLARQRRRRGAAAVSAASAVVLVGIAATVVVPAAMRSGSDESGAAGATRGPTAYVATTANEVLAISVKTSRVLKTIRLTAPGVPQDMAISPNGRTVYVLNTPAGKPGAPAQLEGAVTPISTTTDRAGRPILLHGNLYRIMISPDGSTAYVLAVGSGLIPVDLSTGRPLREIRIDGASLVAAMAPDGKTIYVNGGHGIVPVDLATRRALNPIRIPKPGLLSFGAVVTPDGARLYDEVDINPVRQGNLPVYHWALLAVETATSKALKPIEPKHFAGLQLALGAGGTTLYVAGNSAVLPIATRTGRQLPLIRLPSSGDSYQIASGPDGRTVYLTDQNAAATRSWVVRIATATNTASAPISLPGPGWSPWVIAVAPDGSAYVGSKSFGGHGRSGLVTVIPSGSATAGTVIRTDGTPQKIVFAP
jgi:DNA-binding beta-propeller fold protein YncE